MKEERIIKTIEASEAREEFGNELIDAVYDYEKAKKYLVPVLVKNTDYYKDVCVVASAKDEDSGYPDLIFKLVNKYGDGGVASIPVTNNMVYNVWDIDKSELANFGKEYIKKNFLDYSTRDLYTEISEITDELPFPEDPERPDIKILTNSSGLYGANILLDISRLAQVINADKEWSYLIMPSSIHVLLVMRCDQMDLAYLYKMIREVNENVVDERDQLSDNPFILSYRYDRWTIK